MEKLCNRKDKVESETGFWVRGRCIGQGCFGTVSLAVGKSDGRLFAVKSVDRDACLPGQIESLEDEIRILRSLSASASSENYIVGFLGDDVSTEPPGMTSYRNLHLEYLPCGTVADLTSRHGNEVDESLLRRYTWCIVSALRYVHSRGIVHCDVKGRNILVGQNSSIVKLADFGSAMEIFGERSTALIMPRGSPLWMAPEVIRRDYQGPQSDVWSLGCTIIEMFTGKPAWEDHGIDTLRRIGFSDELPLFPTKLSELGQDFLEKCLRREPSQRWNCDQLLQHPFLSQSKTVVESSPRCVLDWVKTEFEEEEDDQAGTLSGSNFEITREASVKDRIGKLATTTGANWETDGWVAVRGCAYETESVDDCREEGEEGTRVEYSDLTRTELETECTTSVYSDSVRITNRGRIKREFRHSGGSDSVEWQCGNIDEPVLVNLGSTGGLRCCGGGSSRHGGFAVEKQGMSSCWSLYNLLVLFLSKIFRYILLFSMFLIYIHSLLFPASF